jgi:hypothetical protein
MSYALLRSTVSGNDQGQGVHRCLRHGLRGVLVVLGTAPCNDDGAA